MKNFTKEYSVNPTAENILNFIAVFLLVVNIVIGAHVIIFGILEIFLNFMEITDGSPTVAGLCFVGAGIAFVMFGIINWAVMKLYINISRSLYNIYDSVQKINLKYFG